MIMIGPGTGIAPFRAFLQERRAIGATGRNWLFFGNQRRGTDFLYEDELDGLSRRRAADPARHRLLARPGRTRSTSSTACCEHAAELWAWLEDGAHLYVCGDAERMARDVDRGARLHRRQGRPAWSRPAAQAYLARLDRAKAATRETSTEAATARPNGAARCSSTRSITSPRPPSPRQSSSDRSPLGFFDQLDDGRGLCRARHHPDLLCRHRRRPGHPAARRWGRSFGIALTLVIFAGSDLFTGHTMFMTIGWLQRPHEPRGPRRLLGARPGSAISPAASS